MSPYPSSLFSSCPRCIVYLQRSGYGAATGLTVQAAYDMVGNNISVTDGRGATVTYTCNALSRLTEASQPLSTGVTPCSEKSRADIILLVLHTP